MTKLESLKSISRSSSGRVIACQGIRKAAEENVTGQVVRAKISNGNSSSTRITWVYN